ncbi:MAG TPA: glycosyltransferase family 4 protein, partial [Candidatus Aminicenantes bacterium]|nr:glycosyltransferase family 4 protein [Candidatus Aminicenantes bacterium]
RAFAQADIFCFPTYYPYETFGIVLVEAMRAGLPLVASRYSGIPEILAEGEGGFLVPPDSVEGLEGEIERLLLDPSLRESMGSFNRRRFESRYTMQAAVNGWLRLFEELQGQEEGERVAP